MKKYPRKLSPFGREIAWLVRGRGDVHTVLSAAVGEQTARKWVSAAQWALWRSADASGVSRRDAPLDPHGATVGRFCALLLMVLGETRDRRDKPRVCTSRLYRGRTHTRPWLDGDGVVRRSYVRTGHTGGLAARLGCSVKTVERMCRVAHEAGILTTWQAPRSLGEQYTGERWGYTVWQWVSNIPRIARARILSWWNKRKPAAALDLPPPRQPSAAGAAFAAQLLAFSTP